MEQRTLSPFVSSTKFSKTINLRVEETIKLNLSVFNQLEGLQG